MAVTNLLPGTPMESPAPDARISHSPSNAKAPSPFDTSLDVRGTFEVLSEAVDRFIDAWESGNGPPDIASFLPLSSRSRMAVLAELIKVDLEYRWLKVDLPKRLLEYWDEFPELSLNGLPADLIYEEYHVRRRSGLNIHPDEYLEEFPDRIKSMQPLLGLEGEYQSTMLGSGVHAAALADVEVGDCLDDFELLLALGKGAFAKVFLARQKSMQRLVAVKVSEDKGLEPQTLSQLDHNYIVRVHDVRSLPDLGLRLLYMQYIPGGTLEAVCCRVRDVPMNERTGSFLLSVIDESLEKKGDIRPTDSSLRSELSEMPWPDLVAWLGSRLAQALHYSNSHKVQHRDVKPANVLLSGEGVPKLADFNISFGESVQGATAAAYFGGSLAYMSPEQLEACHPALPRQPDELDGRSDLYSLAVVLYELLTGERPFPDDVVPGCWSESLEQMIQRRRETWRDAIDRLPASTPPTLKRILAKALSPDREDRWKDGAELSKQLDLCLNHRARELVDPAPDSKKAKARPWAMWILIAAVLTPNAVFALLNIAYNQTIIIEPHKERHKADLMELEALKSFELLQIIINGVCFSVGTFILVLLAWKVVRHMPGRRQSARGADSRLPEQPQDLAARTRSLHLGLTCAVVCFVLWVLAGIAWPISLRLSNVNLSSEDDVHFFFDLLICGLMATVYPFFLVTLFCVQCVFPAFLQKQLTAPDDLKSLNRLRITCECLHFLAVAIPLLTIAGLSLPESGVATSLVMAVAIGGLVAYVPTWFCHRRILADIDALSSAVA